jgi:hypothetical protein
VLQIRDGGSRSADKGIPLAKLVERIIPEKHIPVLTNQSR